MLSRMTMTMTRTTARRSSQPAILYKTLSTTVSQQQQHSLFKPWKTAMVETHGDYRQESWLEDHIGGPLYQHQKSLPRLPVPAIADTMERFLPTAMPLARTEEERLSLQQAVDKFPAQAAHLQERLLARKEEFHDSSWLQHWWNTAGYLQVRDTVVINVSYFFHFADDPHATTNLKRAAAMLTAVAEFRQQVCSGKLPAEAVGKKDRQKILCSTAYKYMFHSCRIPAREQDTVRIYDPALYHHAIVCHKGHFFSMDFCDKQTGDAYPVKVLEDGLQQCIQAADEMEQKNVPKLGWLTTSNRDDWADARQQLLQSGGVAMEEAFEKLQSGAVLICLDDEEPVSRQALAELFLHGGMKSGQNRWFDKSIQLSVTKNGKAGFMGEHSMMDGMPLVNLANHITQKTYDKCQTSSSAATSTKVEPIFTSPIQGAEGLVDKAKSDFADWVGRHSLEVQSFQGYGSNFMKQAGYSPDAYVQMAMQIATYRLWGEQAGTYEATQVRPFLHGRTETARTVSTESAAFVHKFGLRPKIDEHDENARQEKLQLLQDAVTAHVKYIGLAAQAQGVDRHFFGLSMLVGEGESAPDLYSHPVFARSKRWRVSTSHLTHPKFDGWGFGEVVPDGVGLAYSIHPRHCIFNIMALAEHGWTDKLYQLLEEALLEMRTLIEMDQAPKSKL